MTLKERVTLIEAAIELLETLYVHLPLKRSMYAVNPLQRLKLLRRRLEQPSTARPPAISDRDFFNEMLSIFAQLRDLHTGFVLPKPSRNSTAYLPFRVERYYGADGQEVYVVSQVMAEWKDDPRYDPDFQAGAIITHWNAMPIHRAVLNNAEREAGSNPAARLARGLSALTARWLGQSLPPDEKWVELRFQPQPEAEPKKAEFEWKVLTRQGEGSESAAIARAEGMNVRTVGMDARGEAERQIRAHLFGRTRATRDGGQSKRESATVAAWAEDVFPSAGDVKTAFGTFAYVRIATFNVADDEIYLQEFIRLLAGLSQDGLILDVRGNGGGLIAFGERMLQLLTPRSIEPCRFSFLNSPRTQQLTARHPFVRQWRDSIAQWVETGAEYSQAFPLSEPGGPDVYNNLGQNYQGPVVLVTDALCYSTTDIFAAGFQDHRIGPILGVDETTGAGGANVWDYQLISELLDGVDTIPATLPRDASFHFAVRRATRTGGALLEDLGVVPDSVHRMTRRDVLEKNVDLIEKVAELLAKRPVQQLTAERPSKSKIAVFYKNIDRVDAFVNGHPLQKSIEVKKAPDLETFGLEMPKGLAVGTERELRLQGFRRNDADVDELVAAFRLAL
jgi:hypothetical protein